MTAKELVDICDSKKTCYDNLCVCRFYSNPAPHFPIHSAHLDTCKIENHALFTDYFLRRI